MTVINTIKQAAAVHMLTDGATRFGDGSFGPTSSKVLQLPHLRAIVSARGPRLGPPLIAEFLNAAGRSYDEMKRNAPTVIREMAEVHQGIFSANPFGPDMEIVIAGWSEQRGPDVFLITTVAENSLGLEPWTTHDCGPVMMAPYDDDIEEAVFGAMPASVFGSDDMDPVRDGLAMVMAQREHAIDLCRAGGFVQLTTVTLEAISTRILHRWPDEFGTMP